MKRRFPGLHQTMETDSIADGVYLVRVEQVQYRRDAHKPFYAVRFQVIEPKPFAGRFLATRLYCTPQALWKLSWFLRDCGYDNELLGRDELDEKALVDLVGVGKSAMSSSMALPCSIWRPLLLRRIGTTLQCDCRRRAMTPRWHRDLQLHAD